MFTIPVRNESSSPTPISGKRVLLRPTANWVVRLLLTEFPPAPRIEIHLRGDYAALSVRAARDCCPVSSLSRAEFATRVAFHAAGSVSAVFRGSRLTPPDVGTARAVSWRGSPANAFCL